MLRFALTIILAATTAACTVGPDYAPPTPKTPAAFADAEKAGLTEPPPEIERWWRIFDDPTLTTLVERAFDANLGLKQARLRVREARAQLARANGGDWPTLSGNASYTRRRVSENGVASLAGGGTGGQSGGGSAPGGGLGTFDLYQAGFDAGWELDLFGANRRAEEAARAQLAAQVENRRDARVSLAAEIARNYFSLRGAQRQLAITRDSLKAQRHTLRLIRNLRDAGLATELDAQRARSRVSRIRADIAPLETRRRHTIHRLSTLLARPPEALTARLAAFEALPDLPATIATGLPSTLARRRPDIRAAEQQLHAATADIGVAIAQLFPRFSLTGSFGLQSVDAGKLDEWSGRFFGIGPSLRLPIFQGGRLRANVQIQKTRRTQALNRYRETVLRALREVDDAIVAYDNTRSRHRSLDQSVDASQRALELARNRYQNGLADYLGVLDAQRSVLDARLQRAQAARAQRTDLVALYKALGGGWASPAVIGKARQHSGHEYAKRSSTTR